MRAPAPAPLRPPVLAGDGFNPYVVNSRVGPHVTIQAGVVGNGRFWTTTSRDSLKARSVRSHGVAGTLVEHDDGSVEVLGGTTVALDPARPLRAADDPCAALAVGPAVLRLAGEKGEQLLGYLEARRFIPVNWLPHRRVVLATRIERRLVLDGYDVIDGDGTWSPRLARPSLRLHADPTPPQPLATVPPAARRLLRDDRPVRLGLHTDDGPIVLPARWQGDDRFDVSAAALGAAAVRLPGQVAATFDDSASRRPDQKRGLLLRGDAQLVALEPPRATIALRARRITRWDGFTTDTVDVAANP